MQIKTGAIVALAAVLSLTGCETMTETQRNTAIGVGVGALAGAGVAKATGGKAGKGALIGAAVGGVGTYICRPRWNASAKNWKRPPVVRA